jgi:hypothetical protein
MYFLISVVIVAYWWVYASLCIIIAMRGRRRNCVRLFVFLSLSLSYTHMLYFYIHRATYVFGLPEVRERGIGRERKGKRERERERKKACLNFCIVCTCVVFVLRIHAVYTISCERSPSDGMCVRLCRLRCRGDAPTPPPSSFPGTFV